MDEPLERVRAICLALPETTEAASMGRPTFQVRGKNFVLYMDNHHNDGRLALWCKAPPGAQEVLVSADPARFFVPPYVGHNGWIGIRLDRDPDWDEVAFLLADSYRMTAPKRLRNCCHAPDGERMSADDRRRRRRALAARCA